MPESKREQVWSRVGLLGWTVIVSLSAWSVAGAAETLPASVRACAALTDSLQRLVCYDREVARFPEPAAKTATNPAASASSAPATSSGAASGSSAATPAGSASNGSAPSTRLAPSGAPPTTPSASGDAPSSASGTPAATNTGAAASGGKAAAPTSASAATAKDSDRISARVVTIDHHPNELVLHLDNGQVWQEMQSVSGDLSLRQGDTIKIEKHFGSYWLTGPHVSAMKVRQIS